MARGRTGPEDEDEGCGLEAPCLGFLSGGCSSLSSSLCLVLLDLSHHCCHHLIGEFSFLSLTFYHSSSFCLWLSEELEDLTTHCLLISTDHDVQVCWLVFVEDGPEVLKVEYPQVDPRLDHLLDELHWEHQVHLGLLIGTDHVVLVLLLVPEVAKLEVVLEDHLEEDLRAHLQENRPWEHQVRPGFWILTDHVVLVLCLVYEEVRLEVVLVEHLQDCLPWEHHQDDHPWENQGHHCDHLLACRAAEDQDPRIPA